jgi:simple sugar transport system permease protein
LFLLSLGLASPLILAAMGGYTSERSGVVNIGLEGMMLMAASLMAVVASSLGAWQGVAAALLAACLLSALHWLMTQTFQIDHVISGMAINAIALGGSSFLYEQFSKSGPSGRMPHPDVWFFYGIALVAPNLLWAVSRFTRPGLRLMAIGADPAKARLMGVQPVPIRFWALVATGCFTGLAGALLVSDTGVFTNNMTAGRGFIALAALVISGWRAVPCFAICLGFGFFSALQLRFQGTDTLAFIPSQAWASLPYVITIIALVGFLGKNRTPAGLGKA